MKEYTAKNRRRSRRLFFKRIGATIVSNIRFSHWLLVAFLIFVYFPPRSIYYSEYLIIRIIPFPVIFFIIPILLFVTLVRWFKAFKLPLIIAFLSVFFVGPTTGMFQDYKEKQELKEYGILTKAIVVDKKKTYNRMSSALTIKCKFKANDLEYETLYVELDKNAYAIGDTIPITYSKRYPPINSLIFE